MGVFKDFGGNLAWTSWCVLNPIDCTDYIREGRAAMEAFEMGWTGPLERFVAKYTELAETNEQLGGAISGQLADMKVLLQETIKESILLVAEPLAAGLKPLYLVLAMGLTGLYLWKR